MCPAPRPSTSVVVAGTSVILSGALGIFFPLLALIAFATGAASSSPFPSNLRPLLYGFWIALMVCGLFLVSVGIQVIRLRSWARIAVLISAVLMAFFGLVGIAVILATLYSATPADPTVSRGTLAAILALLYGIPVVVSMWWLILFTRRSVVGQFQANAALGPPRRPSAATAVFNDPTCPLGIRIVGWYLASFVLLIPFIPFLPASLPAVFFGRIFLGASAIAVYAFNLALLSVAGIGLLLLKRWSYPLTIASQLCLIANLVSSQLNPSYHAALRTMFEKMNIPGWPSASEEMLRYSRYFSAFSLLLPAAILLTLYASKHSFSQAANHASQRPANPAN